MNRETCLQFDGALLQSCDPPDWYVDLEREADQAGADWKSILRKHGVLLEQKFGRDLDTVDVYNAGRNGYLIEYWDMSRCLANVFIEDVRCYLEFRSKHLYAWAWLIAESDRIADADLERENESRKRA